LPIETLKVAQLFFELSEIRRAVLLLDELHPVDIDIKSEVKIFLPLLNTWLASVDEATDPDFKNLYGNHLLKSGAENVGQFYIYMGIVSAENDCFALASSYFEKSQLIDKKVVDANSVSNHGKSLNVLRLMAGFAENPFLASGRLLFQRGELNLLFEKEIGEMKWHNADVELIFRYLHKFKTNDVQAWFETASLFYGSGLVHESIASLETVLKLDPEHVNAKHMKDQLPDENDPRLGDLLTIKFDGRRQKQLFDGYMKARAANFYYNIDVVGACNLRCPSCPVGNSWNADIPRGMMSLDTYKAIMEKIKSEQPDDVTVGIDIHNWGESLLHPDLPKIIQMTNEMGFVSGLSSNLTHHFSRKRLEEIVAAKPGGFRVSLSGFTNETHQKTHVRSDINVVKSNLYLLRNILDSTNSSVKVQIGYMVYRHNFQDDFIQMRKLAEELDFHFDWIFAIYMPVEKTISSLMGKDSDEDKEILDLLVMSPKEWRKQADKSEDFRKNTPGDCHLKTIRSAINYDGTVPLCCASYSYDNHVASNFLEVSHEELQKRKMEHNLCDSCFESSAYFQYMGIHPEKVEKRQYEILNELGVFIGMEGR
jgi:MoaA/NifB/PqqE/SkfB family radical SAM enzyme